jgi:hypothetical protein
VGRPQFSPSLSAYLEVGFFNTKTKANGTLGANNDGGVFLPGDPANPLIVHGPMFIAAGTPNNPGTFDQLYYVRPRELGGRDQKTDNQVFRLGLKML